MRHDARQDESAVHLLDKGINMGHYHGSFVYEKFRYTGHTFKNVWPVRNVNEEGDVLGMV